MEYISDQTSQHGKSYPLNPTVSVDPPLNAISCLASPRSIWKISIAQCQPVMAQYMTAVTPVHYHSSYCSLALSHECGISKWKDACNTWVHCCYDPAAVFIQWLGSCRHIAIMWSGEIFVSPACYNQVTWLAMSAQQLTLLAVVSGIHCHDATMPYHDEVTLKNIMSFRNLEFDMLSAVKIIGEYWLVLCIFDIMG